jgi:4-amino-4-deoxy-L-arabinose transferase-like glycosyltransferase
MIISKAHAAGDMATITSLSSALFSWLGTANEVAQLIGSIIAIVAGILAIIIYVKRLKGMQNGKTNTK